VQTMAAARAEERRIVGLISQHGQPFVSSTGVSLASKIRRKPARGSTFPWFDVPQVRATGKLGQTLRAV
jgi:hypothetical protein